MLSSQYKSNLYVSPHNLKIQIFFIFYWKICTLSLHLYNIIVSQQLLIFKMFSMCCSDDSVTRNDFTLTSSKKNDKKVILFNKQKEEAPKKHDVQQKVQKKKVSADDLKKQYQLGGNWIDPEFPHDQTSLGIKIPKGKQIVWKRAHQFITDPVLFKNGVSANDIAQGNIGDCYFLSSIAALATYKNSVNIYNLFFPHQYDKHLDIVKANPAGFYAVYVQIWGKLTEVIVDDYFPVYKYPNNKYKAVFGKPIESEIWVMILEKVWAKHKKNYQNIQSGYPHQVFTYFSNAPCFNFPVHEDADQKNIWEYMKTMNKQAIPTCVSTRKNLQNIPFTTIDGKVIQGVEDVGIISEHSYVLLSALQIQDIDKKKHPVLKLLNPWAHKEWVGRYSDDDPFWTNKISAKTRKQLQIVSKNDGMFYLGINDFIKYFNSIDSCVSSSNENFSSTFLEPITCSSRHAVFLRVNIEDDQEELFFVVNQKILDESNKNKKKFARCKMFFAKQIINQNNEIDYDFKAGKMETNWPDTILSPQQLTPGKYILYIKCQWTPQQQNQFVLTVFADQYMKTQNFQKIEGGIPDFLEKLMKSHSKKKQKDLQAAHQLQMPDFEQLNIKEEGWSIKSDLLLQDGGLGYIIATVEPHLKKKLQIQYNPQLVKQSGFKVKRSRKEKKFSNQMNENKKKRVIQIQPGQTKTIIFKLIPNITNNAQITFPPQIKISQTF